MNKLILLSILIIVGCEEHQTEGCPNPAACNYSIIVDKNDNSCYYGSMTMTADSVFNNDCLYSNANTCNYNCKDSCIVELDCAGVCGGIDEIDECGECGGNGFIPEGACDCEGSLPNEDDVFLWGKCYPINTTTSIDLSNHQLTDTIPSSICNLTNLVSLNLSFNELSGSIPNDIGNLTKLVSLNLSRNQLIGEIPLSIGNLQSLLSIRLHANQLEGTLPEAIWDLHILTELYLGDNSFSGEVSGDIGELFLLEELWLGKNNFSGELPDRMWTLIALRRLALEGNNFDGIIPSAIGNLIQLTELHLSDNQFISLPDDICSLPITSYTSMYDWEGETWKYFDITNNKLCSYPDCIADFVGTQECQ